MSADAINKIDATRIDLALGELRLPGVKLVWAALAATAGEPFLFAAVQASIELASIRLLLRGDVVLWVTKPLKPHFGAGQQHSAERRISSFRTVLSPIGAPSYCTTSRRPAISLTTRPFSSRFLRRSVDARRLRSQAITSAEPISPTKRGTDGLEEFVDLAAGLHGRL